MSHFSLLSYSFSINPRTYKTLTQSVQFAMRSAMRSAMGFPCGSAGKEFACNVGEVGSIPGLGRSPGEGKGYPLQYSGLENSMDYIVHGVTKSQTRLSNFHFHFLQQCIDISVTRVFLGLSVHFKKKNHKIRFMFSLYLKKN